MVQNLATQKMVTNIIDGTTPLNTVGYLNSIPVGGIVMFDRFVNVPTIAVGSWEQMKGTFPFFAGGG